MKAYLMYRDQDFDIKTELSPNADALVQDLELETLFEAMAGEDAYLLAVAKTAILSGLSNDRETILYRQDILMDCLASPNVIRNLYDIAIGGDSRKAHASSSWLGHYPSATLNRAVDILEMLVERLKELRKVADDHSTRVKSEGLGKLFDMLKRELGDDYLHTVEEHLKQLRFRNGVLISAGLGDGNRGDNYVLRQEHKRRQSWLQFLFEPRPEEYRFNLHPRDDAGHRCLSELNDRGINLVANAAAQSADHILSFFAMLRMELAFYVSCLNLHQTLAGKGEPTVFPVPAVPSEPTHCFEGLYDVCLSLRLTQRVVGNDLDVRGNTLIIITGANQGGKSTFLRSIGLAQLMMQCGMFVPAVSFASNMCDRLFTHY
jgi:DNA mismatch repair ATPase MutS